MLDFQRLMKCQRAQGERLVEKSSLNAGIARFKRQSNAAKAAAKELSSIEQPCLLAWGLRLSLTLNTVNYHGYRDSYQSRTLWLGMLNA